MSGTNEPPALDPAAELLRLEARVIEAERRLVPAILHFRDARKHLAHDDPRRKAALAALLWCFFPFNNAASAAGAAGLVLTVVMAYLAYQANTMVQQEIEMVRQQNVITREQFELSQKQFDAQRRADALRRRTELLSTLHARKDCHDSVFRRCPFVADVQTRVLALTELAGLAAILFPVTDQRPAWQVLSLVDLATPRSTPTASPPDTLMGIDFSGMTLPPDVHLQGIDLGDIDLSHAVLLRTGLSDVRSSVHPRLNSAIFQASTWDNVDLPHADLRNARFIGGSLRDVDLHGAQLERATFSAGDDGLENIRLDGVDFTNAFLYGVDFTGATLTNCNFSGARLHDATFPESIPEELDRALSAAAACPDGRRPEGTCADKMTPEPWPGPDNVMLAAYLNLVEAELMRHPGKLGPEATYTVAVDLIAPAGVDSFEVRLVHGTLEHPELTELWSIFRRHGEVLFDTEDKYEPLYERVAIVSKDSLITADGHDSEHGFRREGCIHSAVPGLESAGVKCNADKTDCTIRWRDPYDPILLVHPCRWDRAHAEERVEYLGHDRASVRIHALGKASLLYSLGFRPGDIVSSGSSDSGLALRHAEMWAGSAATRRPEPQVYELRVTRGNLTINKILRVEGLPEP